MGVNYSWYDVDLEPKSISDLRVSENKICYCKDIEMIEIKGIIY